jgi:hypothetical protein
MVTTVFIGNITKQIVDNKINYYGGVLDGAFSTVASNNAAIIITNIRDEDALIAFKDLKALGVKIIISENDKTTTIIENKVVEIANTIKISEIKKIKADYYYFSPTLNSDIENNSFAKISLLGKIALSMTGFMNFIKEDCINVERYQELEENLKYIDHLVIDKDQCVVQEFSHDEDHVAKKYAAKGCTEILVTYYDALFNLRDNFFYRCKYVVDGEINKEKIGDIALASYICKQETLIKEEALFFATSLSCYYMEKKELIHLSKQEIFLKMIEIGIV